MRTVLALACASLALAAEAAPVRAGAPSAPTLSYDWIEGRFLLLDPDEGDDADGLRLAGSALLQSNLFATGGLSHVDVDGGGDYDQLDAGVGLRHPLDSRMDLVGIASLIYTNVDCRACRDDSDIGFGLTGGIRAALAPQFEVGGYVGYTDTFDDGDIALTGEGLFHANAQLSLLGALSLSDDYNAINLGVRWNF